MGKLTDPVVFTHVDTCVGVCVGVCMSLRSRSRPSTCFRNEQYPVETTRQRPINPSISSFNGLA